MNNRALVQVLRADAALSAATGLALVLFAMPIGGFMGQIPTPVLQAVGIGLLLFALDVFWVSRTQPLGLHWVKLICAVNLLWIAATPVVMLVFRDYLNLWGQLLVLDVALVVGVLLFLQLRQLARMKQTA